jgi:hypothetical protein
MGMFKLQTRDGVAIGRGAGFVLADALLQILDASRGRGRRPWFPVGASTVGRELVRVEFRAGVEAAGTWLQTPGLVDAFVVQVADDVDEVRVLVPSADATSFDLVWSLQFEVDGAFVATSEPAFEVADGCDDLLDDFNEGFAEALEHHPRTTDLRAGFGALGEYQVDDDDA